MLDKERGLYVAHSPNGPISLNGNMLCRHGLIAGATGTGKTVTLQVLAETFCQAGVPCFMADMKGDLSGISQAGRLSGFIEKRLPEFGIQDPQFQACPVRFFDVFGEQGHPMRSTISRMGPQMLGRLMDLNETQTGVLNIVFRIADDNGLLLIDLKDLRAMLNFVGQNAADFTTQYGNVTSASVGAIQRALLELENQGADKFFGEPDFDIYDLLQCEGGKGIMNVLAADKLMLQPKLYSTFLLWLLSELYATLPEVGEMELPKLVFFFDEAHMLFEGTSKALTDKIEQVIRLIRSKGVGIWFITQSPTDIPANILGQLGNRVQHALRAYSPQDREGSGGYVPRQSCIQDLRHAAGAGHRRGAGLLPGCEGHAGHGGAGQNPVPAKPDWCRYAGAAGRSCEAQPPVWPIRPPSQWLLPAQCTSPRASPLPIVCYLPQPFYFSFLSFLVLYSATASISTMALFSICAVRRCIFDRI